MTAIRAIYNKRGKLPSDQLVEQHMELVRRIAWHVHANVSSAIDIEDLIQVGMIGLIEAARSYEDQGHAFATYASLRIRGAMIDSLRKHSAQVRSAAARRRAIGAAEDLLRQKLGRQASEVEIAAELNLTVAELAASRLSAQPILHEPLDDAYSDTSMYFADVAGSAVDLIERSQMKSAVAEGIRSLPEREALVLQLYFVEELNLEEIGAVLGIGGARICQIKKTALAKLHALLVDHQ